MTVPYDRKFNVGRQSEQLYNEELHKIYESIKHLLDIPDNKHAVPEAKLDGSLWLDRNKNELKTYQKASNEWIPIFKNKFQIVDQITNVLPPDNPVVGQLWLYNDVLMYFNGSEWKPVKALEQDGSQFNISIFENFILASPLWTNGTNADTDIVNKEKISIGKWTLTTDQNDHFVLKYDGTIVAIWENNEDNALKENYLFDLNEDASIKEIQEARRKYLQNKIDYANDNKFVQTPKWQFGDNIQIDDINLTDLTPKGNSQFLIPNLNLDRIFLDHKIDFGYTEASKVAITYPTKDIIDKKVSLIHVNPGKLTKITKRLVMVDRDNPKININAYNTEYYGFHDDSIYGDLLLPEAKQDDGGYIKMSDGIFLSYNQAQNYDYILAVTYEFSWYKSTGSLKTSNNHNKTSSFYIQDYSGPITIFTDGYNLEETSFTEDNLSKTITINEDVSDVDVSMIHAIRREYGFVRKVDINNRAVIKVLRPFTKPLVFLNGEAIHPQLQDVEVNGNYMYIGNGSLNMTWAVVELYDSVHDYDMSLSTGYVSDTDDNTGRIIIKFDSSKVSTEDDLILYVDGLLVKKEDMIISYSKSFVSVEGLQIGQDYILLRDKYHYFYDEDKIMPALPVGHLSESLVYVDGNLITNDTAIATILSQEQEKPNAVHNQIKFFLNSSTDKTSGEYYYYDDPSDSWIELPIEKAKEVNTFCHSYENATRSIKFNIDVANDDDLYIYAFNYANAIEEPLIIRNIPSVLDNEGNSLYVENQKRFEIKESYISNIGSLSVWVNGIRQYYVEEFLDGSGFELAEPVTGVVTYVIETPENGETIISQREILTEKNIVPNSINIYKTEKPLYPGRVLFYIDGIRQPQSAFTILDNYTILINDQKNMLIGNNNNYPNETIIDSNNEAKIIHHNRASRILVEVKQDYDRQEKFIKLKPDVISDISISEYDLPIELLEPSDEVMIFIDGLFFGLRKSFGYEIDRNRGIISLGVRRDIINERKDKTETTNIDIIDRIINDPLYTYLEANPDKKLEYENTYGEYKKKTRSIIFDWR